MYLSCCVYISGITWLKELTWIIQNDGAVAQAAASPLVQRVPFLDITMPTMDTPVIDLLQNIPHPRLLKTHLPARYFLEQIKNENVTVIVGIRNPKDTLVSFYHFYRIMVDYGLFPGTWDEFFELYRDDHLMYGDYFSWYEGWMPFKDNAKVMFVRYEDMKRDLGQEIRKIAAFLGKNLSDETIYQITQHGQFSRMKDNAMVNYTIFPDIVKTEISPFMRKGVVGDWKNYFNKEQSENVDARYKQWLDKGGMVLDFE